MPLRCLLFLFCILGVSAVAQPAQPRTGAEARLFDVARLHAARPGICDCRVCDRARTALKEILAEQAAVRLPDSETNRTDRVEATIPPAERSPARTTYTPPTYRFGPPDGGGGGTSGGGSKAGKRPKGNNGVGNGQDPQPPGNPRVNDGPSARPGFPGARPSGHNTNRGNRGGNKGGGNKGGGNKGGGKGKR